MAQLIGIEWLSVNGTKGVAARLGTVLLAQKKFQEAESQLLQAYGGLMQANRSNHTEIRASYEKQAGEMIVKLYMDWDKADEAAKWREKIKAPVTIPANVQP